MKQTQKQTQTGYILEQLRKRDAVCGTELLQARIPRYSARILELRAAGYRIVTRPCSKTFHYHDSRQVEYVLDEWTQERLGLEDPASWERLPS